MMNIRTREIVILAVGLALVLGAALGGSGRQVLAPVATPSASGGSPAPQYERWTVGIARRPITVRRRPSDSAPLIVRLGTRTSADYPTLVLVDSIRQVDGVPWYKVWVAVQPNETRGWVRDGALAFYTTSSKIVIDLSRRKLMAVSYTHLRAHETRHDLVCRLLL